MASKVGYCSVRYESGLKRKMSGDPSAPPPSVPPAVSIARSHAFNHSITFPIFVGS